MNNAHIIEHIFVEGKILHLTIDAVSYEVDLAEQLSCFREATDDEIKNIEVSPSGYGLHWPALDEDLSIDGLIGIRHEIPRAVAEQREKWGRAAVQPGKG